MAIIGTNEAAEKLGVTPRRVQAMIKAGRLKAKRISGTWIIDERDLKAVENRKPGRPPKHPKG